MSALSKSGSQEFDPSVGDRSETDDSLLAERQQTDQLLDSAPASAAGETLDALRAVSEQQLQDVRDQVDSHLGKQAEVLPALSNKLANVAADLAGTAAMVADSSGPPAASSAQLTERLAEIATSMADVTAELEDERAAADQKLRTERDLADHIIEQHVEQTATVLAVEEQERQALERDREATDHDLAKERQHADDAIEQVFEAFEEERAAHTIARHEFATRNEFLAIVSHDLRGPLAAAADAAALIVRNAPDTGEGRQVSGWAVRISRSLTTMDQLIKDLLELASFEDGTLQMKRKRQDLKALVSDAVLMFQPLATAKTLNFIAELPEEPVTAPYDRERITQVVSNLVQNAITFTPRGGAIRLSLFASERDATVSITDSGQGLAEEDLSSVFERLKQFDGDRSGLGLGLYIDRWIIEAHGGQIWAESRPGEGATLSFTLPR